MTLDPISLISIPVREGIRLSSICLADKRSLVKHLQAKEIHDNTLTIPHPYGEADADAWLQRRMNHTMMVRTEVTLAIRNSEDEMIGSVGTDGLEPGTTHRAELGYWLAVPYWGQRIMTAALRAYINYAFTQLQLTRLVAHVFERNTGSARVLENNGFTLEGRLRAHYLKNGELLDARIYGLLKKDLE